jgi:integrase
MNEAARVVLLRRARIRAEICPDTPWVFFHVRRVRNKEIGGRIGDVKRSIKSAARMVGLEGVTFYTLRHTCASWPEEEGVYLPLVRDVLGHGTTEMAKCFLRSAGFGLT